MTKPLGCAIDFGTTNSSIALVYEDEVRVVTVAEEPRPKSLRSILYLHRNGQRAVGEAAIRQYSQTETAKTKGEPDSRLMLGLKHDLTDVDFTTTSWDRTFTLSELVGEIIRALKRRAEEEAGTELERVVVGHPVAFADGAEMGSVRHDAGLRTLSEAARWAGFTEVEFLSEPEGALWALEESISGNALTVDFGGGTCDIAILRLPHARVADEEKVLLGLPIGGEKFDAKLFEMKIDPALGLGKSFRMGRGSAHLFPAHIRVDLRTLAHALQLMREPQTATILKSYASCAGGEGIEMLREILYGGHAYNFYDAIENAKIDLSDSEEATIAFSRRPLGIAISEIVNRTDFEGAVASDLEAIETAVREVLDRAALKPHDVDVVLRTGGSSSIPSFLRRLEAIFGAEKVIERPVFTTVVYGLGLYARELWVTPREEPPAVTVEAGHSAEADAQLASERNAPAERVRADAGPETKSVAPKRRPKPEAKPAQPRETRAPVGRESAPAAERPVEPKPGVPPKTRQPVRPPVKQAATPRTRRPAGEPSRMAAESGRGRPDAPRRESIQREEAAEGPPARRTVPSDVAVCDRCGGKLEPAWKACPRCGQLIAPPPPEIRVPASGAREKRRTVALLVIVGLLLVVGAVALVVALAGAHI